MNACAAHSLAFAVNNPRLQDGQHASSSLQGRAQAGRFPSARKLDSFLLQFTPDTSARHSDQIKKLALIICGATACGGHEEPIALSLFANGPQNPCHGSNGLRPFDGTKPTLGLIVSRIPACDIACQIAGCDKAQDRKSQNLGIIGADISNQGKMASILAAHEMTCLRQRKGATRLVLSIVDNQNMVSSGSKYQRLSLQVNDLNNVQSHSKRPIIPLEGLGISPPWKASRVKYPYNILGSA
jgi:hypothetical protein